jgi:hypothetical protein
MCDENTKPPTLSPIELREHKRPIFSILKYFAGIFCLSEKKGDISLIPDVDTLSQEEMDEFQIFIKTRIIILFNIMEILKNRGLYKSKEGVSLAMFSAIKQCKRITENFRAYRNYLTATDGFFGYYIQENSATNKKGYSFSKPELSFCNMVSAMIDVDFNDDTQKYFYKIQYEFAWNISILGKKILQFLDENTNIAEDSFNQFFAFNEKTQTDTLNRPNIYEFVSKLKTEIPKMPERFYFGDKKNPNIQKRPTAAKPDQDEIPEFGYK